MKPQSREAMDNLYQFVQENNGGHDPRQLFNITPRVAQAIETKVQQSNDFLGKINNVPVDEIAGDILALSVPATITKRTNTTQGDGSLRRPTDPTALQQRQYFCHGIEQDTIIPWKKIDAWAHLPDFYQRIRGSVQFAQARDMILTMWYGQTAADDTDPTTHTNLEDVQRSFFQFMIDEHPENALGISPVAGGGYTVDEIRVGPGAGQNGYESLEQMVFHMKSEMIHRLFRKRQSLRVITGDKLIVTENARMFGIPDTQPTEKIARELYLQTQQIGQVTREMSDEFPSHGLFISEMDNFSHYWQKDSVRAQYDENSHAKKGVASYYYKNCDNVMEAAEGAACAHPDAIHLPTGYDAAGKATGWAPSSETWKMA